MNKMDKVLAKSTALITNKQSRSVIFLIISVIAVLALNALLPLLEGNAHYTNDSIEVTYAEYERMYDANTHYNLTYKSKMNILAYKADYIIDHPDLSTEQKYNIEIPADLMVSVYTQYFFKSYTWYITTLVQVISVIFIYVSLTNYLITRHKTKYTKYIQLEDEVNTLVNTQLDPNTFEPYMHDVFNKNRKITQHKYNVKYELDQLEKHLSYDVRTEIRLLETYDQHKPKRKYKHAITKYINKRNRLNDMLTDEYINKYVVDGKVKHFVYVHPIFVLCGVNSIGRTYDSYSNIHSDTGKFSKDLTQKMLTSILFSIVLAILVTITVVSSSEQSVGYILINILTKIVPLTLQIPAAYDYRDNFMETQLMANLMQRRNIAFMFLAYKNGGDNIAK